MSAALRYALYAWILASAAGLVVQLVRRRRFANAQSKTEALDATTPSSDTESAAGATEPSTESEAIPERGTAGSAATAEADTTVSESADATAGTTAEPALVSPVERSSTPEPIAALLTGIRLPASLEPIVADGIAPSDHFLCLHTNEATPEEVGTGLAEELERLGYEVMGISENEAVAKRNDDVVSLHIDATPAETAVAGIRRYPMASAGDVVVEVWSGAGPKPST